MSTKGKITERLLSLVGFQAKQARMASEDYVKHCAFVVALEDAGETIPKDLLPVDIVRLDGELAAADLTIADFNATAGLIKRRIGWSKIAPQREQLLAESNRLATDAEAFDIAEARRHREALKKLAEMKAAADRKSREYLDGFEASELLKSTSATPPDTAELTQQLLANKVRIEACEEKLSPTPPPAEPGAYAASLTQTPGCMIRELKAKLADDRTGYGADRRKDFERQLALAEAECDKVRKELAALKAEHAAITAKLAIDPEAAMRPENVDVVRHRPGMQDRMKSNARDMGWHDGSGVTLQI